jgi:hypothetical protein
MLWTKLYINCTIRKFTYIWGSARRHFQPCFISCFFDVLLRKLSTHDEGCHTSLLFVGALAYADDLVLIAPSANATRHMLQVSDDYVAQYNVLFNAAKSKCLYYQTVGVPKHVLNSFPHLSF